MTNVLSIETFILSTFKSDFKSKLEHSEYFDKKKQEVLLEKHNKH